MARKEIMKKNIGKIEKEIIGRMIKRNIGEEYWKSDEKKDWGDESDNEKHGPYSRGTTKKSTYYEKYGLNGSWTKAASNSAKITQYFVASNIEFSLH
ncbi:hypothetical protein G9A89_009869 [Geosiphon pyriformis]|nr:hypothetical protein G9A89_009869 [Geosiphon pyriformis]